MLFFVCIQFLAQLPCQSETGDEAVDGQILSDLVFAVDDLQYQFSLWLTQLFDEFLVTTFDFRFGLRSGELFIEDII